MTAHCAALTKTIRLGPAVVVLPLHHPLRAAQEIAMLQLMLGGRLNLGIGTGHQPHEFESFGVDIRARTAILHEGWDIVQQGLTSGSVDHQGTHYRIPPTPLTIAGTGMPALFLAGGSPDLLARAARAGATPFISQGLRQAEAALGMKAKVESAYRASGHTGPMPLAVQRYVFVTDDAAEMRAAADGLLRLARTTLSLRDQVPPRDGFLMRSVPFEGEPSIDWLLEHAPIGPADKVLRILGHDVALLQPSHISLYTGFTGLPRAAVLTALERLGALLPDLRRAPAALAWAS